MSFMLSVPEFQYFGNSNGAKIEAEVRFGHFTSEGFQSELPHPALHRTIRCKLEEFAQKYANSISKLESKTMVEFDHNYPNIRKITDLDTHSTIFQSKIKTNFDVADWGARFSRSTETEIQPIDNFLPSSSRYRKRVSYIDTRRNSAFFGFQIDLTEVIQNNHPHLELELEAIGETIPPYQQWQSAIQTLQGWLWDAKAKMEIISLKERYYILDIMNRVTARGVRASEIKTGLINRPKTLTQLSGIRDHAVSVKLDGFHKLLVTAQTGIYLCSAPFNIKKIGNRGTKEVSILEGEYLPNTGEFFAFDIIAYSHVPIMERPFEERYQKLKSLIEWLSSSGSPSASTTSISPSITPCTPSATGWGSLSVKLRVKEFWFPPDTPLDESEWQYKMDQKPNDGLIFQPLTSYKSGSIWKWKPSDKLTVDFYLLVQEGRFVCYLMDNNKWVVAKEFQVESDLANEDLNRKVVECKKDGGVWKTVRIRDDKEFPNTLKIARQNLEMIKNEITLAQIVIELIQ